MHTRVLIILVTAMLALPATAAARVPAAARARVAIVGPSAHRVAGEVRFAARFAGQKIQRVVFSIDGHRWWTATRRPFRYDRTGRLNTRRLRNGVHLLSVRAFFRHRRSAVARRRVDVVNSVRALRRSAATATAAPAPRVAPPSAFDPPLGGTPGPSVAAFNRETYRYSTSLSTSQEANQHQVLVLQSTDGSQVAALKAANPKLRIFVYQHPWFSRVGDPSALSVCTSYPADSSQHTDWFLHDANGQVVPARSPGNYLMDIGNPTYQQACIQSAITLARKWGFDGIFWDGIAASLRFDVPSGTTVPEYPTNASWQNATTSFVTAATTQLHAAGLQDIGNLCGTTMTAGLWQRWSALLDGSEEESFTDGGLGLGQQNAAWGQKLLNAAWSEANGKYAVLHSYNGTEAGNTFGLASMMLVAGGHLSYSTSNTNYTSNEAWYPEYATAQQLGAPAGGSQRLSNGVYERAFSNGIVLVNPTGTAVPPFALGGGVYSGSGVSNATTAQLGADSALILLKVG